LATSTFADFKDLVRAAQLEVFVAQTLRGTAKNSVAVYA
jgi:hypothetical protein